ncbi:hypothetical protein [Archangium sp.]|uniref:hypothetical protein n=1 Tax=Archangium sp. TaxID=1872627 RepID=UPI00389A4392
MRPFFSVLLPLSLGLALTATACDPDKPGGGAGNDAGSEDAGGDEGKDAGAGTDAGTTDAGTEEPGDACTLANPQPSECVYGSFCGLSATCQTVPAPACSNFSGFPVPWDPSTSSGPVIYAAELISFATDDTYCPPTIPTRLRTRLRAYSLSGGLPQTASELAAVFSYVRDNGSSVGDASLFSDIVTSGDRKNMEFQVSLCFSASRTTASLGFYFEGGNAYCQVANK